jgi:hypothetical protein
MKSLEEEIKGMSEAEYKIYMKGYERGLKEAFARATEDIRKILGVSKSWK